MNIKTIAAFASAVVALFIALSTSYFALAKAVETKPSRDEVRQIVEDKTRDRLDEVLRRQEHMDKQLDRLGEAIFRLAPSPRAQ